MCDLEMSPGNKSIHIKKWIVKPGEFSLSGMLFSPLSCDHPEDASPSRVDGKPGRGAEAGGRGGAGWVREQGRGQATLEAETKPIQSPGFAEKGRVCKGRVCRRHLGSAAVLTRQRVFQTLLTSIPTLSMPRAVGLTAAVGLEPQGAVCSPTEVFNFLC